MDMMPLLLSLLSVSWLVFLATGSELPQTRPISLVGGSSRIPGQVILGAMVKVHPVIPGTFPFDSCYYGNVTEDGIQALEAIFYSLNSIMEDPSLLVDISFGLDIFDSCAAYLQMINYLRKYYPNDINRLTNATSSHAMVTLIDGGPASAKEILKLLNYEEHDLQIPQISYASTAVDLSDKTRFGYFSRVVAPDTYQAQAMVDVVKAFNWTYVSTLADEGDYGEKGIDTFMAKAERSGICIAKTLEIPRDVKIDTFTAIILELLDNAKAKVVVLFVNEDNCHHLIRAAAELGATDKLMWLASDSWGAKLRPVKNQESAAEGTITILPQREVVKAFDEYFLGLNPIDNVRNPWFVEYWEKRFECSFTDSAKPCSGYEQYENHKQEGVVPFVIEAVYAIAHALHNMIKDECHGANFCAAVNPPNGYKLLQYIRNVSFTGISGQTVSFNKNGDAMGRYTIYQYQRRPDGHYEYVPIGNWSDSLTIDLTLPKWRSLDGVMPRSVCSEPCPSGYRKKDDDALDKCCWVCLPCESHMILKDESTCMPCENGSYPDPPQTTCRKLPLEYMTLSSAWSILPIMVASMGILMTLFVGVVFIRFHTTPVIMASGRELCYVLLVGLLMCYGMTFIMVSKPTTATCSLMRIGLGLSLSICYSAVFTKTNRISRIFNRGVKAVAQRPGYTSPKSQLIFCFGLVSVQILVAITWIGIELPATKLSYPDRKTVVLRCVSTNVAIVLSLLYNMILILMCTVYAFKTRKIPENFNEAKHIAFTMYSTCILWLSFIPIYFGTHKSDFRIHITALCMCVSISATVALGCLFVPKVYIVLFQPHKNVRQGAKGSMGSGATGRAFFGRPSSRFSSLAAMNGNITSPTGIALLIAKGSLPKEPEQPESDKAESLKDLDSSGHDNSDDPETHV